MIAEGLVKGWLLACIDLYFAYYVANSLYLSLVILFSVHMLQCI